MKLTQTSPQHKFRSNRPIRRTKSLDDLLPLLYLNGISTNRFQEVLQPILGSNARNVSSQVICKLKENWQTELAAWRQASLEDKEYAYWWVDGVYLSARMENEKTCMLVIIGATDDGTKELVAFVGLIRHVYLNQGGDRVQVGQKFEVHTKADTVIDPSTGEHIPIQGKKLAELEVTSVTSKYAIAKVLSGQADTVVRGLQVYLTK